MYGEREERNYDLKQEIAAKASAFVETDISMFLDAVVREFLLYYNHERPHYGLGGKLINPGSQDEDGEVMKFSRLGGLLKSYRRVRTAA